MNYFKYLIRRFWFGRVLGHKYRTATERESDFECTIISRLDSKGVYHTEYHEHYRI